MAGAPSVTNNTLSFPESTVVYPTIPNRMNGELDAGHIMIITICIMFLVVAIKLLMPDPLSKHKYMQNQRKIRDNKEHSEDQEHITFKSAKMIEKSENAFAVP
eukprot:915051_1